MRKENPIKSWLHLLDQGSQVEGHVDPDEQGLHGIRRDDMDHEKCKIERY